MRHSVFAALLDDTDSRRRGAGLMGLRYAEVQEITEEGYVLEWLSGADRSASAPARAASFMAGNERGAYFPFEVGDEVVVGFIEGNRDQPVILGALWSEQDPTPEVADTSGDNNTRSITSRSGHVLMFDDTSGSEVVRLTAKPPEQGDPMTLEMDVAGGKVTLSTGGTGDPLKLELDASGGKVTLQFSANNKIELSADGVKVTGTQIDLN